MEHEYRCVEVLNKICKRLNKKYEYYIQPNGDEDTYTRIFIKQKDSVGIGDNVKAKITIRKDGVVLFRIDTRECVAGISFEQRILSKSAEEKEWLNITCSPSEIEVLLDKLREKEQVIASQLEP